MEIHIPPGVAKIVWSKVGSPRPARRKGRAERKESQNPRESSEP